MIEVQYAFNPDGEESHSQGLESMINFLIISMAPTAIQDIILDYIRYWVSNTLVLKTNETRFFKVFEWLLSSFRWSVWCANYN